ncbi:5'-methylthioadenosine/adenosylhomocysteine nucleosidase [Streptococcus pantholopis]|uniref:adenosylhomocysteine nucleosidase n=1 Tax=Streptococcus pantholopis TaxID=1811193 RepID=A0A172Q729_9STRE|nr:5'-methylthioadenosine/adenosylhomocysteine nucleosidase [Streptococcus pantholopis]AND79268.1 5'-methylthioadenosine nucleosidase [Streptococcus pantholopis]
MKIGIIAAMEQELRLLLEELQEGTEQLVFDNTYYTGKIGGHDLVLVQSGVGKVMSAMSVAVLADRFAVDAVINTGSAGAASPDLAIGDTVIADKLAYHDVDLTAFGYNYGEMSGQPLYFKSDPHFIEVFKGLLEERALPAEIGLIVTGDSFIAGRDKIRAIMERFPQALAVEMEGAAVAQAAHAAGKPFIVIRAMSDTASHDADITFNEFVLEAGRQSAQLLLDFLERLE